MVILLWSCNATWPFFLALLGAGILGTIFGWSWLNNKYRWLMGEYEEKEKAYGSLQKEKTDIDRRYGSLNTQHETVVLEKAGLENALNVSRGEASSWILKHTRITGDKEKLNSNFMAFKASASQEQEATKAEVESWQFKHNNLNSSYESLKKEKQALNKQFEAYKQGRQKSDKEAKTKYSALQLRYNNLEKDHNTVNRERASLSSSFDGLSAEKLALAAAFTAYKTQTGAEKEQEKMAFGSMQEERDSANRIIASLKTDNANLIARLAKLQADYDKQAHEKSILSASIEGLKTEESALAAAFTAYKAEAGAEKEQEKMAFGSMQEERDSANSLIASLETDNANLTARLTKLQAGYDKQGQEKSILSGSFETLNTEKLALAAALAAYKIQTKEEKEQGEMAFGSMQEERDSANNVIASLETDKADLNINLTKFQGLYEAEQQEKVSLNEAFVNYKQVASKDLEDARTSIADWKIKHDATLAERNDLSVQLNSLKKDNVELKEELAVLNTIATDDLASANREIEDLRNAKTESSNNYAAIAAAFAAYKLTANEELDKANSNTMSYQSQYNSEAEDKANTVKELESQLTSLHGDLDNWKLRYDKVVVERDENLSLIQELEKYKLTQISIEEQLEDTQAKYNTIVDENLDHERLIAELRGKLGNLDKDKTALQNVVNSLRSDSDRQVRDLETKYAMLNAQHETLIDIEADDLHIIQSLEKYAMMLQGEIDDLKVASEKERKALSVQVGVLEERYKKAKDIEADDLHIIQSLEKYAMMLQDEVDEIKERTEKEQKILNAKLKEIGTEVQMPAMKMATGIGMDTPAPVKKEKPAKKDNSKEVVLARIKEKAKDLDFDRIGYATAADADDLKKIKGIGPFIEEKLNALSIYRFCQLSKLNSDDEDNVNKAIEFFSGRVKRDNWVGQAKEFCQAQKKAAESTPMKAAAPAPVKETKPAKKDNSKEAVLARIKEKAKDLDFDRIGYATAADADDLKKIKGIGPFIEEKLNALSIYRFCQLAKLNSDDEDNVNKAIEFFSGRVKRDNWVGQAKEFCQEQQQQKEDKPAMQVATPAPAIIVKDNSKEAVLERIRERGKVLNFDRIGRATAANEDDLRRISGVGSALQEKLNTLGIYTFQQIANFNSEDEETVNDAIEFFPGRVKEDEWVKQAKAFLITSEENNSRDAVLGRIQDKSKNLNFDRIGRAKAENKDDLKLINGIGSFIEEKLNSLGIFAIQQIANFNDEDETQVNDTIELLEGQVQRDNWVKQAKYFLRSNKVEAKVVKQEAPKTANKPSNGVPASGLDLDRIGHATEASKDPLQRIKGLSADIETKLHTLGIYTFRQIANFTTEDEIFVSNAVGLGKAKVRKDRWTRQAKRFSKRKA